MSALPPVSRKLHVTAGSGRTSMRTLPEETPVAIVYNGTTQAVMMATPGDLEDFAIGFALSDHAIAHASEVHELEIVPQSQGIEARLWLDEARSAAIEARRRHMAGPVGCGLCGIDSLGEALHPITPLAAGTLRLTAKDLERAPAELRDLQPLHDETHAVHAAGFYRPGEGVVLAREDVGRHNAFDKLLGAMARASVDGSAGAFVVTARISVDLVQKCAVGRVPIMISVSSPTAHAVRLAEAAGITLARTGRDGRSDIFSHPDRITPGAETHVA
jgi:FdhD protein